MNNIVYGNNFMFYIECQTLTGDMMLPICEAKSVQLQFQSDITEATKSPSSKWKSFYYGRNSYALSLDGLVTYSDKELNEIIVEVNNALLMTNNALVSIGGEPFSPGGAYFCLENALFNWKTIKWSFEGTTTPIKWSGEVLVSQLAPGIGDPNGVMEFSSSLQGTGEPKSFHTPPPTSLKKTGQSNTLPTEDASYLSIAPVQQGNTWLSGVTLTGNPLPNGVFTLNLGGTSIGGYAVRIGDTLESIALNIATLISDKVLRAYVDDDTVYIETSSSKTLTAPYTPHTGVIRSVYMSFQSKPYDFYRFKVDQNGHTWFIDTQGTNPTLILPVGSYDIAVAGMGTDLQYSDYSETIQITVS